LGEKESLEVYQKAATQAGLDLEGLWEKLPSDRPITPACVECPIPG
jgi:hypothetical protein